MFGLRSFDLRLDLRRIWVTTRLSAWDLIVPVLLAGALVFIFIFRGTPEDAFSTFIFFSTLYFFWTGLFATCQIVNGAIESGEWAYWVLGTRRAIKTYLVAQVIYQAFLMLLITVAFCATLLLLCWVGRGYWTDALVNPYIGPETYDVICPKELALFLGDETAGKLAETEALVRWGILARFVLFHGVGLFCAGFAGIVIGLILSGTFRKPLHSITAAIFMVMVTIVVSFTSLNATRLDDGQDNPLSLSDHSRPPLFLPVLYAWQEHAVQGRPFWDIVAPPVEYPAPQRYLENDPIAVLKTVDRPLLSHSLGGRGIFSWLHAVSFFLPQRYFFNISHVTVPRYGYLSRGGAWGGMAWGGGDEGANAENVTKNPCTRREDGVYCPCVYCLQLVPHASFNPFRFLTDEDWQRLQEVQARLGYYPGIRYDYAQIHVRYSKWDTPKNRATADALAPDRQAVCWLDDYEPRWKSGMGSAYSCIPDCFKDSETYFGVDLDELEEDDRRLALETLERVRASIRQSRAEELEILYGLWWKTVGGEFLALLCSMALWIVIYRVILLPILPIRTQLQTLR